MGGRKRKKVVKRVPKRLPTVFSCPECGGKAVRIDIDREAGTARVKCGRCKLEALIPISSIESAVDAYGKFIDDYYGGGKFIVQREAAQTS